MILNVKNIHLFSFNNRFDITTDLNNYKDALHYGTWVNSLILHWMHDEQYRLTKDNYWDYLKEESEYYLSFDYKSLNQQIDYENDLYADALCSEELTGIVPVSLIEENMTQIELKNATVEKRQHDGKLGIKCVGSLQRNSNDEYTVEASLRDNQYIGASIVVNNIEDYRYLVFYGKKVKTHGQPTVMLFNEQGAKVGEVSANYRDIDNDWHMYLIDVSKLSGQVKIVFNGGYIDNTGDADSAYTFSDIHLY